MSKRTTKTTQALPVQAPIEAAATSSEAQLPMLVEAVSQDEFASGFPLTAAALASWAETREQPVSALEVHVRISARREGFRRAGMMHNIHPVDHPISAFRLPEQLEALLAEPMLSVELV